MAKIYTAGATNKGGRNGVSKTDDGNLEFNMASPGSPNAKPGTTNPEQLFACGYSACFGGALEFMAKKMNLDAKDAEVHTDVHLNQDDSGFTLSVEMIITLPNVGHDDAQKLVEATHAFCPYSKATQGNIEVTLRIK